MDDLPIQHILVVDEDHQHQGTIREFLQATGYSCATASGAAEALDLLDKERFDIVIADADMEGMDGLELIRRGRYKDSNLDFMLMLGGSSKYSFSDAIAAGARDFISKPFPMEELKARVQRIGKEHETLLNLSETKEAFSREVKMNSSFSVLSVALIDTLSFDAISSLMLKHAMRLTDSQLGYARCLDRKTGRLMPPVVSQCIEENDCRGWDREPFPDESPLIRKPVLEMRESMFTNKAPEDPAFTKADPDDLSPRRLLAAPAVVGESLVGVLVLGHSTRDYTERDMMVVNRLAALYAFRIRRKWANEDVREAKSYLEKVLDNTVAVIGIIDGHGKAVRWNKYAVELLGYSFEELREKHFSTLYANQEELARMLSKLRREGFVRHYEINMKKKDGGITPVQVSISLLRNDAEEVIGSVGVAMDMSDRVTA